jgi:hypothetical protein
MPKPFGNTLDSELHRGKQPSPLDASKHQHPIKGSKRGNAFGNGSPKYTSALRSTSASFQPAWLHSTPD